MVSGKIAVDSSSYHIHILKNAPGVSPGRFFFAPIPKSEIKRPKSEIRNQNTR